MSLVWGPCKGCTVHVQMIFRLKMKLRSQVRWHVPACGGYLCMPEPAPLEAKLLTLLLPSPVALEVRSILAMSAMGSPQ